MKWEMVRIDDVCKVLGGTTPSTSNTEYWEGENLWLSPTDLPEVGEITVVTDSARKISKSAIEESSLSIIPVGGIIYSTRASIGKIGIAGKPLTTNQGFTNLVCGERVFNRFLAYALKNFTPQIAKLGNSTTFPEVSRTAIKNFQIPLPPLPTQHAIADRLDRADALRQKDRQLLQAYDDLAQSVFVEMFGDPVKNEKGWEVKQLRDCCIKITDGTHFSPPNISQGIPYVTAKHLRAQGLDFFSNPTFISEYDHIEIYARCRPEKGDVLYIKDGATTGIAAVNHYDFEFSMLSSLALLKPDVKEIDPYFLCAWLNHESVKSKYLLENMSGAAIKRFTLQKINKFDILIPPLPLQTRFATILANIERQKELVRRQQVASEALFGRLLQEAFGG